MNTTSSPTYRLTDAGRLAIAFLVSLVVTVASYNLNMPWVYVVALPTTVTLFLFTGEKAYEAKARAKARAARQAAAA